MPTPRIQAYVILRIQGEVQREKRRFQRSVSSLEEKEREREKGACVQPSSQKKERSILHHGLEVQNTGIGIGSKGIVYVTF